MLCLINKRTCSAVSKFYLWAVAVHDQIQSTCPAFSASNQLQRLPSLTGIVSPALLLLLWTHVFLIWCTTNLSRMIRIITSKQQSERQRTQLTRFADLYITSDTASQISRRNWLSSLVIKSDQAPVISYQSHIQLCSQTIFLVQFLWTCR